MGPLIHGHEYDYHEKLAGHLEGLDAESKYKQRLGEARDEAYKNRGNKAAEFDAKGRKYKMTYEGGKYKIEER